MLAGPSAPLARADGCQFVLGFQTLHELDPADIGDCTENQAFAPNGDAQQHTTKGLMAWRKADNWTVFTNGYMTWLNGPNGLQSRLNTDRFPWETDAGGSSASAAAPAGAGSPAPSAPAGGAASSTAAKHPPNAFAKCVDGTYDYSPGRKPCNDHGGAIEVY
jgi:hypothetical protein